MTQIMTNGGDNLSSKRNGRVALISVGVAVAMLAMAYAAVPLYRLFCQVTGFGGTVRVEAMAPSHAPLNRKIEVRFDANTAPDLAWDFEPVHRAVTLNIGEEALIYYRATNLSRETVTATSTFNVTPDMAGSYFNKIACFCFTEQTLKPGESIDMPVSFYVDPEIVDDADLRKIRTITLSYTFYRVKTPQTASLNSDGAGQSGDKLVN